MCRHEHTFAKEVLIAHNDPFTTLREIDRRKTIEYHFSNKIKEYKMFNVIAPDEAKAIEQNSSSKGMFDSFLHNLENFHTSNATSNFMVHLNRPDSDDPFAGKATDSLYGGLNTAINRNKVADNWKLIRFGKRDENPTLVIARKAA